MPDTFNFASTTPRHGLPNLFTAQAQKEFTVNEAFALIDSLLHVAVEGETDAPPAMPGNGECWLVGSAPSGIWTTHAEQIASYQSGNWLFVSPVDGMTVFDRSAAQIIRFNDGWVRAAVVAPPSGGATVDTQARDAIAEILGALQTLGLLPAS